MSVAKVEGKRAARHHAPPSRGATLSPDSPDRAVTTTTVAVRRVADVMVSSPKTHGPEAGLAKVRAFFEDDHHHMALIVASDGRLLTTIERPDLAAATSSSVPIATIGTLIGRTAWPADPLAAVTVELLRNGRRRLAVIDYSGRLLGLLCLKKDGTGYCSDEGIRERALARTSQLALPAAGAARRVGVGL